MRYALLVYWLKAFYVLMALGQSQISNDLPDAHSSRGLHLPLFRRPARFSRHSLFNITHVSAVLIQCEKRYLRTITVAKDNRIVRKWRNGPNGIDQYMFDGAGFENKWYTVLKLGDPPQEIEVEIDMLSPDFYFIVTSSDQGSKYDVFSSTSKKSSNEHAHPLCPVLNDFVTLSHVQGPFTTRLDVPICQPGRYSLQTLSSSGAVLGLSPLGQHSSLSRISTPGLLTQLLQQNCIEHNIFSLTLLDSESGVLSLGGSIAHEIEEAKIRAEKEFAYIGNPDREMMENEIRGAMSFAMPPDSTHEHHFKWTDVGSGAVAGWHMTLATGVWINGVKVLKNQPVLLDVNCPFILAPPGAVKTIYETIPGGRVLSSLFDDVAIDHEIAEHFYTFPCLNQIEIAFEIAGWRFPFGKSELREDAVHGPFGGRFSLGQVDLGENKTDPERRMRTGYCVGAIVKTTLEFRKEASRSAMRDVWVLGEPFFRGLGVAFDMGGKKAKTRVGVRVY